MLTAWQPEASDAATPAGNDQAWTKGGGPRSPSPRGDAPTNGDRDREMRDGERERERAADRRSRSPERRNNGNSSGDAERERGRCVVIL